MLPGQPGRQPGAGAPARLRARLVASGQLVGSLVGPVIGGILPTANALIGRSVSRETRGTIHGMTASATFLGNSLGPPTGGGIAAWFGTRWAFVVTAPPLAANLLWVWFTVPELPEQSASDGD